MIEDNIKTKAGFDEGRLGVLFWQRRSLFAWKSAYSASVRIVVVEELSQASTSSLKDQMKTKQAQTSRRHVVVDSFKYLWTFLQMIVDLRFVNELFCYLFLYLVRPFSLSCFMLSCHCDFKSFVLNMLVLVYET